MSQAAENNQSDPPGGLRTLVLVGLMGAGKTTAGRRLAKRLGVAFVDSDSEVEKAAGCSVDDIFSFHGEAVFRDVERRVIFRLLEREAMVLATGGGAFMDAEIRQKIGERATTVWLRADLDILLERVSRRDTRPLLRGDDARAVLARLIDQRYPVYAQADIIVDTNNGSHNKVVETILKKLAAAGERPGATAAQGALR